MLYLLGGTARAGKTRTARRFLSCTGVPYFSLDFLMMAAASGLPDLEVDSEDDERVVGEKLWPILEPMAQAMIEEEIDYLIEGAQLLPHHAAALARSSPAGVRACFLGYAEAEVVKKLHEIRRYGGGEDDWLRHDDDAYVSKEVQRFIQASVQIRAECRELGIPYVEAVPFKHDDAAESVVQCLVTEGSVDA